MKNKNPWLTVIGIEDNGLESLSKEALDLIASADVIYGGERHLAMLEGCAAELQNWQSPFSKSIAEIKTRKGRNTVVLATGDPQWFGVGAMLGRIFSSGEMRTIPARSSFSLAASAMGWSLAAVEMITLHGRPFSNLARFVQPNARLLILTKNGKTPERIAFFLSERGFGASPIVVMEHLGGEDELIRQCLARDFNLQAVADLNIVAVECIAGVDSQWFPTIAGLPDDAFHHDGQLTKQVVRAASLAALRPYPGALLWDIGAGCGSIAIEWMRAAPRAKAIAIEARKDRTAMIAKNADHLGVPGLQIVEASAPAVLAELPEPDAIFIGGGLTTEAVFETCWQRLKAGGALVANGVTLESEARLIELHREYGGALTRVSVEHAAPIGAFRGWQPARPVTQWAITKPGEGA